jgi:predicted alpha/beta superfamily hydrolase
MKKILNVTFLICSFFLNAQEYPEVKIADSQIRKISSKTVLGQEYELQILLPSNYQNSTKKYPVLYVMDSQWDFTLAKSIYGQLYFDGFIPEIIIVGVTWGGEKPNPNILRARDYTPTNIRSTASTGGAAVFLDFMKTELFPFVETNYRAENNDRTLMGCSLGGLFTLYTLFTHPDMFDGYIAASPAISWDNGILNQYEKQFSEKQLNKPVRVYMTVGDVEMGKNDFEKFAKKMFDKKTKNVFLHSKILENTGHSNTKTETYSRGLQFVFERNKLTLTDAVLNKYTGTYHSENNTIIKIKNENNKLKLYMNETAISLFADSESHFYAVSSFLNIFFKDNKNTADGLDLTTFDGLQSFHKITE